MLAKTGLVCAIKETVFNCQVRLCGDCSGIDTTVGPRRPALQTEESCTSEMSVGSFDMPEVVVSDADL